MFKMNIPLTQAYKKDCPDREIGVERNNSYFYMNGLKYYEAGPFIHV